MKAQVLLPKIFNYPFTYESNKRGNVGDFVEVPFGTKKEIGIIWKNNHLEPKNIKIKNIKRFVKYSINKKLVNFIEWFSRISTGFFTEDISCIPVERMIGFPNFAICSTKRRLSHSPEPILKAGTFISFKKSAADLENGVEI